MSEKKYYVKANELGTFWHSDSEMTILHRENGPAVERASGIKEWWLNGQRHREDGPAAEYSDGGKEWWLNHMLHRENGPAIEYGNGVKEWWLNGECYYEADFHAEMKKRKSASTSCEGKIVEIDGKKYKLVEV